MASPKNVAGSANPASDAKPAKVAITFASASDLASALRRAESAHGEHEKRIGHADANWPDWYAAYMVAEQSGKELPI